MSSASAWAAPYSVEYVEEQASTADAAGFADETPAEPLGGNSGTTLGQQRRIVLEAALARWADRLESDVEIRILASFNRSDLGCSSSVIAAQSGPAATAVLDGLGYPIALANRLRSTDLTPATPDVDIEIDFNPRLDDEACGGEARWYYGLNGEVPSGKIDLLNVAMHELAHGLGFSNLVDEDDGTAQANFPDIFSSFTYDLDLQRHWVDMSTAQRSVSARNTRGVVWSGPRTRIEAAQQLAAGLVQLAVHEADGRRVVLSDRVAEVLPSFSFEPVTAELVPVEASEACTELDAYAGLVVLVDDSVCRASDKLVVAQAAGVSGLVVGQDAERPSALQVVSDFQVELPGIAIDRSHFEELSTRLEDSDGPLLVTLYQDLARLVGADSRGRPYLYADPNAGEGNAITHWDPLVRRAPGLEPSDLLMEAELGDQVGDEVDLTLAVLQDMGWLAPDCGNGDLDPDEACDEGAANSDVEANACRRDCTRARCGDAATDDGEDCDNGSLNSNRYGDACREDCTEPSCGDEVVDFLGGEDCDEGDANSDVEPNACRTNCRAPACGDGVIDDAEECDNASDNDDDTADACREDCRLPRCGDGVVDATEDCDEGGDNGAADASCSASCERVECPEDDPSCVGGTADAGCKLGCESDAGMPPQPDAGVSAPDSGLPSTRDAGSSDAVIASGGCNCAMPASRVTWLDWLASAGLLLAIWTRRWLLGNTRRQGDKRSSR